MTIRFLKNAGTLNTTSLEMIYAVNSDAIPHIGSDIVVNHTRYFVEDVVINYDGTQNVDVVVTLV